MSAFVVKNWVKQALRMCGHAFVSTVHERLDAMDKQVGSIIEQNTNLARTQTALLQSSAYVVTALQALETELSQHDSHAKPGIESLRTLGIYAAETQRALLEFCERMDGLLSRSDADTQRIREALEQITGLQRCTQQVLDERLVRGLLPRYDTDTSRIRETLEQIASLERHTQQVLDEQLVRQVCVEADDYAFANPEVGLMSFLYSYMPSRKALDIGAHVGNVSERLLKAGYEVYAFEPYVPTYEKLVSRLGGNKEFHPFNLALARVEAELPLHLAIDCSPSGRHHDITQFSSVPLHSMPHDLPFTETVLVSAKPLMALQPDPVPEDVGLVKIDTEGYDLEVIRGMGDRRYPVVVVEFWDTRMPFGESGLLYTLDSIIDEMRSRGYGWHIVLYRVYGRDEVAFYSNHDRPIPASWGNIFFFREHATFAHAEAWCAAVLPRTYFKPAPANGRTGNSQLESSLVSG